MHKSRNFFSAVTKKWLQHNFTDLKYIFVKIRNFVPKLFWGQLSYPKLAGTPCIFDLSVCSNLTFVRQQQKIDPTVTVLLLFLRSVATPKKLGKLFGAWITDDVFYLQKKVRQASERDLRYQVKNGSVLLVIFGFVSFQLQKIEFLVLYLTSWISPLGGPFRWGTSWDKDK